MKSHKQLLLILCLGAILVMAIGVLFIEPARNAFGAAWSQLHSDTLAFLTDYRREVVVAIITALCGIPVTGLVAWLTLREQKKIDHKHKTHDDKIVDFFQREDARKRGFNLDFPFDVFTVEDLSGKPGINCVKYVERQSAVEYQEIMRIWNERKALLIQGRAGLGKKREAVQLMLRLQANQGKPYRVLIPQHNIMDKPTENEILKNLKDLKPFNIILFVPNVHEYCPEEEPKFDIGETYDFQDRLRGVISRFEDVCKWRYGDFRVIATVDSAPTQLEKTRPTHVVWQRFHIYPLRDFIGRTCWSLIEEVEDYLKIELEPTAKSHLHKKNRGAATDIIFPLENEKANGKQKVSLSDIRKYDDNQPDDYYKSYVAPYPERVYLIMALDLLHQAKIECYEFIVASLATRLWGNRLFGGLHHPRISRALSSPHLQAWISLQDGRVRYSAAFVSGRSDLAKHSKTLTDTMLTLSDSAERKETVLPSLWSWAYVLDARLRNPRLALKVATTAIQLQSDWPRGYLLLSGIYSHLGDHEKAISTCKTALDIAPQDVKGWETLGIVYEKAREHDEAVNAFKRASADAPDDLRIKYALGITLSNAMKYDEAIAALDQVTRLDRDWGAAWIALGIAYDRAGQAYRKQAESALEEAARLLPWSALVLTTQGRVQEKLGDFEGAIQSFEKAITLDPDLIQVWNSLSVGYSKAGQNAKALEAIEHAIQLKPREASLRNTKAILLRQAQRAEEALVCAHQAHVLEPTNPSILVTIVTVLIDLKREEEANSYLQKLIKACPNDFKDIGIVLSLLKRHEEALPYLQHAFAQNPEDADVERTLGFVLSHLKRYEEALPYLQRALARNPEDADVERTLGFVLNFLERPEEALPYLQKALARNPEDADVERTLGYVLSLLARHGIELVDNGKMDEGLALLEDLREIMPHHLDVLACLGSGYRKIGRPEAAIRACQVALEIKQDHTGALYALGRAYLVTNQLDEADEAFSKTVALKPNHFKAWQWKAVALERMGKYEEAAEARTKVGGQDPSSSVPSDVPSI